MTNAAQSRPRRVRSRSAATVFIAVSAAALTAGVVVSTAGTAASAAPARVSVSHVDTVGFPYVDLVVGGLPGFGLGPAPTVRITQDSAPLRTTSTWELSPANPVAVVVDAPASRLARAQGLVAELVQAMPPSVPIALSSVPGGGRPGLDRDAVMSALSHQAAHRPTTLARGLAAAESAGVQHILVVTTCAGPAPQPAPAGVVVDVVGVGPACTDGWLSLPRWGAGQLHPGLVVRRRAGRARRHGRAVAVLRPGRHPGPDPSPARRVGRHQPPDRADRRARGRRRCRNGGALLRLGRLAHRRRHDGPPPGSRRRVGPARPRRAARSGLAPTPSGRASGRLDRPGAGSRAARACRSTAGAHRDRPPRPGVRPASSPKSEPSRSARPRWRLPQSN